MVNQWGEKYILSKKDEDKKGDRHNEIIYITESSARNPKGALLEKREGGGEMGGNYGSTNQEGCDSRTIVTRRQDDVSFPDNRITDISHLSSDTEGITIEDGKDID